jgi:hypothetical protein
VEYSDAPAKPLAAESESFLKRPTIRQGSSAAVQDLMGQTVR